MEGSEIERKSIEFLKKCISVIQEKGKEYSNANLEKKGPFTGSTVCQRTGCMVDKKMIRIQSDKTLNRPIKEDSAIDFINNFTFHLLEYNHLFCGKKGKQK